MTYNHWDNTKLVTREVVSLERMEHLHLLEIIMNVCTHLYDLNVEVNSIDNFNIIFIISF